VKSDMKADRTIWSVSTQSYDCIRTSVCKRDWRRSSVILLQVGQRMGFSETSISCDLWTSHPYCVMVQPDLVPYRGRSVCVQCIAGMDLLMGGKVAGI